MVGCKFPAVYFSKIDHIKQATYKLVVDIYFMKIIHIK